MSIAPIYMKPEDAAAYAGVGRSAIYVLLAKDCIRAKKFGRRLLVERASLDEYLAGLPGAQIRVPSLLARAQ